MKSTLATSFLFCCPHCESVIATDNLIRILNPTCQCGDRARWTIALMWHCPRCNIQFDEQGRPKEDDHA